MPNGSFAASHALGTSLCGQRLTPCLLGIAPQANPCDVNSSLLSPGIGLYPTGALINHSCTPNAVQTFDGSTIHFTALAPIAPGKPPDVIVSGIPTLAEQAAASCKACSALPPAGGHACWPPKQCASGLGHCCMVSGDKCLAAQLAASGLERRFL